MLAHVTIAKSHRRRTLALIGAWGLIQTIVTFVLFLMSYGSVMHRFDTGEAATLGDQLIGGAAQVFAFPIVTLLRLFSIRIPGLLGWAPFILNGLLWSSLVVLALQYRRRRSVVASS
jgi:hypothetical protein